MAVSAAMQPSRPRQSAALRLTAPLFDKVCWDGSQKNCDTKGSWASLADADLFSNTSGLRTFLACHCRRGIWDSRHL